jgi:hypothetical protein
VLSALFCFKIVEIADEIHVFIIGNNAGSGKFRGNLQQSSLHLSTAGVQLLRMQLPNNFGTSMLGGQGQTSRFSSNSIGGAGMLGVNSGFGFAGSNMSPVTHNNCFGANSGSNGMSL